MIKEPSLLEACESKASPNFEEEYYRHRKEIKELTDENERLKKTIIGMCETLYGQGGGK